MRPIGGFQLARNSPQSLLESQSSSSQDQSLPLSTESTRKKISVDSERVKCTVCRSSITVYCPDCALPAPNAPPDFPRVNLPMKLIIIRHEHERPGKSTAIHAKVIAPESTEYLIYSRLNAGKIDQYLSEFEHGAALLFPSNKAMTVDSFKRQKSQNDIQALIVIDGSWEHVRSIMFNLSTLHRITHFALSKNYETSFWRCQKQDSSHLATIEAITFFFQEWSDSSPESFDDLMAIYQWQYDKIIDALNRSKKTIL